MAPRIWYDIFAGDHRDGTEFALVSACIRGKELARSKPGTTVTVTRQADVITEVARYRLVGGRMEAWVA